MLKHPVETEARIRLALERIESLIYSPRPPWKSRRGIGAGSRLRIQAARKAKYVPFSVGEMWGSLWDTSWFRFRGQVPKSWKGREVVALVRLTGIAAKDSRRRG